MAILRSTSGDHSLRWFNGQTGAVVAVLLLAFALLAAIVAVGNPSPAAAQTSGPVALLANGQTVSGLSGSPGEMHLFAIQVPANATNLSFTTTGGIGDADLYVRHGAVPTFGDNDCFLDFPGNEETCNMAVTTEGRWYVGVKGYSHFAGVAMTGSYDLGGPDLPGVTDGGLLMNEQTVAGISGSTNQQINFHIDVPADAQNVTFTMAGGSGDADLYVAYDAAPTLTEWTCRPWIGGNEEQCVTAAQAGRWHASVVGFSDFAEVTLTASWSTDGQTAELTLDEPVFGLAGSAGDMQMFTVDVPTGSLLAVLTGGTGDADIYVRQGVAPTLTDFDCFLDQSGNEEVCASTGAPGRWYVGVRGYADFADVSLAVYAG